MSANQELSLLTHDVKDEYMVKRMTCMFKTWEAAWEYRQNYIMYYTILYIHKGFCKLMFLFSSCKVLCMCVCVGGGGEGGGWVGGCDE